MWWLYLSGLLTTMLLMTEWIGGEWDRVPVTGWLFLFLWPISVPVITLVALLIELRGD